MQSLSELQLGDKARVTSIHISNGADRQKLFACGLVPGAVIAITRIAPLGDPVQIRLDGNILLSLRKAEACNVKVDSINR